MSQLTKYKEKVDIKVAEQMALNGKTQQEIAEFFGLKDGRRISDLFKHYGIKYTFRRKHAVNDNYFDVIDTEAKAYILGFLIADGCVKEEKRKKGNSYRICFSNSVDDKEAIELIHKEICPTALLTIVPHLHNRRKKEQYNLQWTSEHMFKTLNTKYGISPRKTYDKNFKLPENAIPDHLWRHFIRGFFDGDGHVGACSIEFVFTSKPFMEQIMGWFNNFNYRIEHIQGKTTDYYKCVINAADKVKKCISDFFYKDANYYLKRKYEIFNTVISYTIANRCIEIVEHRVE